MTDALILTGFLLVIGGLWLAWPPLTLIGGGAMILTVGLTRRRRNRGG